MILTRKWKEGLVWKSNPNKVREVGKNRKINKRGGVYLAPESTVLQENFECIVVIPMLYDDVEFEVENIQTVNDLKEGEIHIW